jgi:hypothetical protein
MDLRWRRAGCRPAAIQGIADAFGRGKGKFLRGGDGDCLARYGFTPLALGPVDHPEAAKPGECHVFTLAAAVIAANAVSRILLVWSLVMPCSAARRNRGRYLGGAAPFGFCVGQGGELIPVAAEQPAIQHMRELRGQGLSLRNVAEQMDAQGFRMFRGHAGASFL